MVRVDQYKTAGPARPPWVWTPKPLVVLLSGQSNAQGVGADAAGGTYLRDRRVKAWDGLTDGFVIADIETETYTTTTGNPYGDGKQNGGVAFCHRLRAETGRNVYLYVAAKGGQSISQWIGDGTASTIYAGMKSVIESTLPGLGKTGIDYFIWQHGEANASEADGVYRGYLATLMSQLRAERWFPATTPVIAGEPCPDWTQTTRRDRLIAELAAYAATDSHFHVADSSGLVGDGVSAENIHFSNASMYTLGYERYWSALTA